MRWSKNGMIERRRVLGRVKNTGTRWSCGKNVTNERKQNLRKRVKPAGKWISKIMARRVWWSLLACYVSTGEHKAVHFKNILTSFRFFSSVTRTSLKAFKKSFAVCNKNEVIFEILPSTRSFSYLWRLHQNSSISFDLHFIEQNKKLPTILCRNIVFQKKKNCYSKLVALCWGHNLLNFWRWSE